MRGVRPRPAHRGADRDEGARPPAMPMADSSHGTGGVCRIVTTGIGSVGAIATGRWWRLLLRTTSNSSAPVRGELHHHGQVGMVLLHPDVRRGADVGTGRPARAVRRHVELVDLEPEPGPGAAKSDTSCPRRCSSSASAKVWASRPPAKGSRIGNRLEAIRQILMGGRRSSYAGSETGANRSQARCWAISSCSLDQASAGVLVRHQPGRAEREARVGHGLGARAPGRDGLGVAERLVQQQHDPRVDRRPPSAPRPWRRRSAGRPAPAPGVRDAAPRRTRPTGWRRRSVCTAMPLASVPPCGPTTSGTRPSPLIAATRVATSSASVVVVDDDPDRAPVGRPRAADLRQGR